MNSLDHILFVEDDAGIRGLVADLLKQNGYQVSVARNGEEMDALLAPGSVDLLMLDIMLPMEDGLSLCRRVRAAGNLPIIMLTARGSEIDRVVGLEMGADDYLSKPFSTHELLARVRALLRRARSHAPSRPDGPRAVLTFSGWRLDPARRRLNSPDGIRVALTSGEFDLLLALCEHPNRVLTRDELGELARSRISTSLDRSIDIQISRLRRKLEDNPKDPELIQTVRSGGYIFTAEVVPE